MQQVTHDLFDSSPIPQMLIDPYRDKALLSNIAARQLLDTSEQEISKIRFSKLIGKSLTDWVVFTEEVLELGEGWSNSLVFVLKDKSLLKVELTARLMQIESKAYLLIDFQDSELLDKRRMEKDRMIHYQGGIGSWARMNTVFQEFEKENHLLLEAAGEGIYGIDADGNTTFLNPAGERILGWRTEELLGKNAHEMLHHSHRTGAHYHVEDCPIYHAFRDGMKRTIENEVFWTKDNQPIDVEYTSTPIRDKGNIMGAVVVFRDVTQKRLDQNRLLTALNEVESLKNRLEQEKAYLQEEIRSEINHTEFVGNSPAVDRIQEQIALVAPTDATVLIHGESGTGKELIARAIHETSTRRDRPLIRVNCAAIPPDLFESEMFGHTKGAFTGATAARIGRFELADGGTLFLDEVGEIPLSLQGKLLVVLQEQIFERVGESKTRKVDVRVIAATNRNLSEMVKRREFRDDLYFRLNVFPIESVPLRERRQDIPLLAEHFLRRASRKANKPKLAITDSEMEKLLAHNWPGNVRELENLMERQAILATDNVAHFSEIEEQNNKPKTDIAISQKHENVLTEQESKNRDKQNIISALQACKGKVFGKNGAAERIGIKPTTLTSRIKKYNINIRDYKPSSN